MNNLYNFIEEAAVLQGLNLKQKMAVQKKVEIGACIVIREEGIDFVVKMPVGAEWYDIQDRSYWEFVTYKNVSQAFLEDIWNKCYYAPNMEVFLNSIKLNSIAAQLLECYYDNDLDVGFNTPEAYYEGDFLFL